MAIYLHRLNAPRPPLKEVAEQVMEIPRQGGIELRNHAFKMIYVLSGKARLRIDNEDLYTLAEGDLIILPHACKQHYTSAENRVSSHLHVLLFQFTPEARVPASERVFAQYLRTLFPRPRYLKASSALLLRPWVMALRRLCEAPSMEPLRIGDMAALFVLEAAQLLGVHPAPIPAHPWGRAEKQHLELLRATTEKKPQSLSSTLLQQWLGMPLSRYRNLMVIEKAKEMMIHQMEPIAVLSRKLGFSSPSVFSRTFRQLAGVSPKEYQQQLYQRTPSAPVRTATPPPPRPLPAAIPAPFILSPGTPWQAPSLCFLFCLNGSGTLVLQSRRKVSFSLSDHEATVVKAPQESLWQLSPSEEGKAPRVIAIPISTAPRTKPEMLTLPQRRELELARTHLRTSRPPTHSLLYGYALLRSIAHELGTPMAVAPARQRAARRLPTDYAMEYLRKHVTQAVRLADVAWFAGVSEEHLSRLFLQVHGQSVMEALKQLRIERAKRYLQQTEHSVTEIALLSGFSTTPLFCRTFKQALGCTPSAYRDSLSRDCKG